MSDLEEILESHEQLEHLKVIREYDYLSRMSIINSMPVYGRDLRKAVKIQSLVSNLYQKQVKYCTGEIPSTVLNPIASSGIPAESGCTCEDLDNNDIPEGCEIVLECVNKKIEKRKPKKIPTFKFDPNNGPEFQHLMEEFENEDKKLVVTIDLGFLYGQMGGQQDKSVEEFHEESNEEGNGNGSKVTIEINKINVEQKKEEKEEVMHTEKENEGRMENKKEEGNEKKGKNENIKEENEENIKEEKEENKKEEEKVKEEKEEEENNKVVEEEEKKEEKEKKEEEDKKEIEKEKNEDKVTEKKEEVKGKIEEEVEEKVKKEVQENEDVKMKSAEKAKNEEDKEKKKEGTESFFDSEDSMSASEAQHENIMSEISDNDDSESLMSDEANKKEREEVSHYLTRSKQRALENKPVDTQAPYNGATVELIPIRFIEQIDHQNETIIEEPEESKELLLTEEDIKADLNKFFAYRYTDTMKDLIKQPNQRQKEMNVILRQFKVIQPKALALGVKLWPSSYSTIYHNEDSFFRVAYRRLMNAPFVQRALRIANFLTFPDRKLIQYDSGKLQKISLILKRLRAQSSKVLIFTQMSKMLDIIECFLNLHGYTYVRLDGSIKVETRQAIVDRFNNDPRILCFISSTRCGGIGINLTSADAVIFYDSDWNPAMDKQAQDRCHRIGQTKTVHIYRMITLNTIEENIFKKSLQKREIGGLIMEDGQFDTEFFKKIDFKEVVEEEHLIKRAKPENILVKENIHIDPIKEEGKEDADHNPEMMKKLEDALIVVEDKEDVEAAQNAKKEIVDEFEFSEHEDQPNAENAIVQAKPKRKEESEFKKNEIIDWENDDTLLTVTKKSLQFYQKEYSYEEFYNVRSANDKRFIPEETPNEENEEENKENSESESASVISDTECDELPASVKLEALEAYEQTKKSIVDQEPMVE